MQCLNGKSTFSRPLTITSITMWVETHLGTIMLKFVEERPTGHFPGKK